jgi:gliding motility-associated-like protein
LYRFFSIISILLLPIWLWAHEGPRTKPTHDPHFFIENKGQWQENILFKAEIGQGNVLVTKEGILYQLLSFEPEETGKSLKTSNVHSRRGMIKGQVIKATFPSSTFAGHILKEEPMSTKFQFIKGKGQKEESRATGAYKQLVFQNVYDGIDLILYFNEGALKYDFRLKTGANPELISILYEGADSLAIVDGFLTMYTQIGKVYEKPPYTFQIIQERKKEVACHYKLKGNTVSFDLPKGYHQKYPLVIDPQFIFSTYSGSRADNWGNTATYDSAGNFYSGGVVFGDAQLPIVPGPFQAFKGGMTDVFLLKYSPDGKNLLFAAYLGGSGPEIPISMIVNEKDELIVMGITGSYDFPTTPQAFDSTFNGGEWTDAFYNLNGTQFQGDTIEIVFGYGVDIFVSVINTNTASLVASTYFGGELNDGVILSRTPPVKNYGDQLRGEVQVDASNSIYIASHTYSTGIPGTSFSNRGLLDAIMVKFDAQLSTVTTLFQQGGQGHDSGFGVHLDSKGNIFMAGSTTSPDLFKVPITGVNTTYQGNIDGYICKLDGNTGTLLNGTYVGTSSFDQCYFIDIDFDDYVYVFGLTKGNYPTTPNTYFNTNGAQFVHAFNNNLTTTYFSTKVGSGKLDPKSGEILPDISPTAFLVNNCKKIFLSGWGGEVNLAVNNFYYNGGNNVFRYNTGYFGGNINGMPITKDAFQATTDGTGFYFLILHPAASSLAYATFFGGTDQNMEHVDGGTSRFDKKGVIYQSVCAGCGGYSNLPTPNNNVWSTTNNSYNCNNAAIKFDLGKVVANFETFDSLEAIPSQYGCVPITFLLKNKSSGATNYKWEVGTGIITSKDDSIFVKFNQRGKQELVLIAFDTTICRLTDTARAMVNAGDVRVDFPKDRINCGTQPFVADVKLYTPWAKVEWQPTTGLSDPTIANPVITPTHDMTYVITIHDDTLCVKSDTFQVKVRNTSPLAKFVILDSLRSMEKYTFCYPATGFFENQSIHYDTLWWKENGTIFYPVVDSFYYAFNQIGQINYSVSAYDTACKKLSVADTVVTISYPIVTFPSDVHMCPDSSAVVQVSGDPRYKYEWSPLSLFPNPTGMKQVIRADSSGVVSILVTDSIGCQTSGAFSFGLFGIPDPIADKYGKICPKKTGGLTITAISLKEYDWAPSGSTGNSLTVSTPGLYYLHGVTWDGCPVVDSLKVVQKCDPEIHVPDAFSPDGDGRNDFFQVFGHEITSFDIKIFDRWGELIYHSSDFRFQWDGTYRNQTVPIGTYPYIITYAGTTFEGERISKTQSGDVTVVR